MGEDKPSQLRDELKRRRELREAQLQEGTPVRLVGRYPAPVAVAAEAVAPVPPAIHLEVPVSRSAPPRKRGPGGLMIALMLVPAVVALVSTSLLLYVLLLERHPDLFAANEGESVQAAEEEETEERSRWTVSPRSGSAPAGAKRTAPEPAPRPEPQPETAAIDIAAQQRAVQLQLGQIAPAPPPQQGVAATTALATVAPAAQQAPPAAPPPQQAQMAPAPAQTPPPPPQPQQAAPPIQRVPPEIVAQWGDPGLQPVQSGAPAVPQDQVLLLLIRSSLFGLHRSNMTGNYQFLRSIASMPFQQVNPGPKLFQAFANLRQRGVDLSPAMSLQPKLIKKPEINQRGVLRVSGFFPTDPERIYFDLKFLRGPQGRWRLFGITVDKLAPKPAAEAAAPAGAAQPAAAQLGPAEAAAPPPAEPEPQASAPAPAGVPPLPARKPAIPAGSGSEAPVGEGEEATAGTAEDVYDQVDESEAQEPQQKRFWPFRRKDAE